ncbi:unnamed protein product [Vitrella brassicaformis CCMP3155]|uniref:FHA domain-containing protein n=3 Tax=Vitrella brassicaformis TaxID=1169539 RepID=A0A0G4GE26_VITBC|nr:unnamed protein product [Vitrella brassicaformis CCMP3155]|eukprot:CEM27243.1 unnamed protein product [Vitrella brassicaformis CCMP3155]
MHSEPSQPSSALSAAINESRRAPGEINGTEMDEDQQQKGGKAGSTLRVPRWCETPATNVWLEVWKANQNTETIPINQKRCYLIGRNRTENDIITEHDSTSRCHAAILHHYNGSVFVMDLGSTHGTFLDSLRLEARTPTLYQQGMALRLGNSSRRYLLKGDFVNTADLLRQALQRGSTRSRGGGGEATDEDDEEEPDPLLLLNTELNRRASPVLTTSMGLPPAATAANGGVGPMNPDSPPLSSHQPSSSLLNSSPSVLAPHEVTPPSLPTDEPSHPAAMVSAPELPREMDLPASFAVDRLPFAFGLSHVSSVHSSVSANGGDGEQSTPSVSPTGRVASQGSTPHIGLLQRNSSRRPSSAAAAAAAGSRRNSGTSMDVDYVASEAPADMSRDASREGVRVSADSGEDLSSRSQSGGDSSKRHKKRKKVKVRFAPPEQLENVINDKEDKGSPPVPSAPPPAAPRGLFTDLLTPSKRTQSLPSDDHPAAMAEPQPTPMRTGLFPETPMRPISGMSEGQQQELYSSGHKRRRADKEREATGSDAATGDGAGGRGQERKPRHRVVPFPSLPAVDGVALPAEGTVDGVQQQGKGAAEDEKEGEMETTKRGAG